MRWFGGSVSAGRAAIPVGARMVWSDPPLWTAGPWPDRLVRTRDGEGARITVFGTCSAQHADLGEALTARNLASTVGDWAGTYTVVRLQSSGDVEIITDAASACPLYMVRTSGGVVWGSSSFALSSLTRSRVDADWLASYLCDRQMPRADRSAWTGVVPIPPGHCLTLAAGTGAASASEWWVPAARSYEQALLVVRRTLTEGVRTRVEGVTASADLAGTDSTTLAVIAARYGPVATTTLHPEDVTEGGDLTYARALTIPSLSRTYFPLGPRHLPFAPGRDRLPVTDEPAPSTPLWSLFSEQLRAVARTGTVCHLTGDGGDNLFLPPPTHLADLARHGRLIRTTADAHAWARLRRTSPWPVIRSALRGDAHRLARPWLATPPWAAAPAVTAGTGRNADAVLVADVRGAARLAHADIQLAETLGVDLHNPYFDGALLEAVVSVPSWQRFSARRYKPVLIDAVGDLLPPSHRGRAAKGVFAADFHHGVRSHLARVLSMADGRLAAMGLIEPAPLQAAIRAVALGADTVWPSLLTVLGAEMWLESVEGAPATVWERQRRLNDDRC
ncbi:albusnodin/ikarugamycin family macrolactam cyclase [Streptomyces sp. NPDC058001]|uniref:albusnodin/ikarugamycin family macrolactam cyclase n=1 Tax=Streptomyces sp. NPDC058001 TaxID=3346300 RepID=UPI0036DFAF9A